MKTKTGFGVGFLVCAAASILAACAPSEDGADIGEDSADIVKQGQCDLFDRAGKKVNRAKQDDPFARLVLLTEGEACPSTVKATFERVEQVSKKPGRVFVVSEDGDKPTDRTRYRFVVSQEGKSTKGEELFFSTLASKEGVENRFLEVMAWSPSRQGYNYYHLVDGRWVVEGNGAQATPGTGAAFECLGCHVSGGPLMKEQQDAWANWHSTWFDMPNPETGSAFARSLFEKKEIADGLEPIIVDGIRRNTAARAARELASGNLKGLLAQVMCEVAEPTFVSSHVMNFDRHDRKTDKFPDTVPSVFMHQMFGRDERQRNYKGLMDFDVTVEEDFEGFKLVRMKPSFNVVIDGQAYKKALAATGMQVKTSAGMTNDAMFPMFTPDRGFADNVMIEELLERKLLDRELVADLLMTDFTVPAYSKIRCDLAQAAPTSGASAEEVRAGWAANLAGSTLPGAADLKARLETKGQFGDHAATFKAYLKSCATRAKDEKDAFARDLLEIIAQRRAEFLAVYPQLVESEALLPKATKLTVVPHAKRFDPGTCTLK